MGNQCHERPTVSLGLIAFNIYNRYLILTSCLAALALGSWNFDDTDNRSAVLALKRLMHKLLPVLRATLPALFTNVAQSCFPQGGQLVLDVPGDPVSIEEQEPAGTQSP